MGHRALIAAKLAEPVPPPAFVVRDRLHQVLDRALDRDLTLVVGPAGSGKSALVASWLRSLPADVARIWITLDGVDTPARFFHHLAHAVTGRDDLGADRDAMVVMLHRRPPSTPVVIVVDDLHLARSRALVDDLAAVVDAAPPHVHVVLLARADPPFVARGWPTRRGIVEIRSDDLRFTDDEVAAVLAAHPSVALSPAARRDLTGKVDGWVAGLQLALASLVGQDDPDRAVAAFDGTTPAVADYLLAEVLDRLDPGPRAFLLDVAVLDRLTGDACRRLTGRSDALHVLAGLARDNFLIERYSDDSYRYHPLLQQLLQLHLKVDDPERFRELHRRAAVVAEDAGNVPRAAEHLVTAEDYASVVALCLRHREALAGPTGSHLVLSCLARIPAHALTDPDDQLDAAWLALHAGDTVGCAYRVERCQALLPPGTPDRLRGRVARLWSHCHHRLGDAEAALRASTEADALLQTLAPAGPPTGGDMPRAFGLLWRGRPDEARSALGAVALPSEGGWRRTDAVALGLAARIAFEAGDLAEAWVAAERAEEAAASLGLDAIHPDRLHALAARAQLLVESMDDGAADDAVDVLLAVAELNGGRDHMVVGFCQRVRLRWTSTCVEAGIGSLSSAAALDHGRPLSPSLRAALARIEARLWIEAGDPAAADRILARTPDGPERRILACRARAATGAVAPALAALDAIGTRTPRAAFAVALARARVLADTGEPGAAGALRVALDHERAFEWRRAYLEEGEGFGAVLRDMDDPRAAAISADLDLARQRTAATALSRRELAVLQFLPTRLTNQEIGAQIFVSLNTVKTHLKSLYRRLGVNSRDEAVRRARQLGLLPVDSAGPPPSSRPARPGVERHQRHPQVAQAVEQGIDVGDHAFEHRVPG